jgi:hypothetical protein
LLALPSGIVLGNVLRQKNILFQIIGTGVIVLLSFGGIWGQLQEFVIHPQGMYVSQDEQMFFQKIAQKLPKNSFIIYLPQKNATTLMSYPFSAAPVVAVMTGRPTYFEPESAQFDLKKIYADRRNTLSLLQQAIVVCNKKALKQIFAKTGGSILISLQNKCLDRVIDQHIHAKGKLAAYFIKQ